ncbi:exopolysaccharide production protein ExoZ [Hyphomicrobium sp. 1Nfss2.1]|uniref:acyltransferase family protein n=1 Tax=Hyphomicrobium sp. 1Nfss2.1 TaxID=3413936 RepID=UPI003C7DDC92
MGGAPRVAPGGYHSFIDGLRAVSIITVVAYHAGVPGFGGGFIGVDVFFVISGYLIISLIQRDVVSGQFSFAEFWARRIRRIVPAYLAMLAGTSLLAWNALLFSDELVNFAKSAQASALMVSNHFFYNRQGYFDVASDAQPMLHTWSLSVEEQFYVIAPVVIFFGWRYLPRKFAIALAGLAAAASLAGCIAFAARDQSMTFFIMPFRAWEFVAGGAVGFIAARLASQSKVLIASLGFLGVALIATAAVFVSEQPYPSYFALLPVVGAVMALASGLADPHGLYARVLSLRPLAAIGVLSYGWYLWHWPLISLGRITRSGEADLALDSLMAAIGLLLAVASYFLVERPIRKRQWRFPLALVPVGAVLVFSVSANYTFKGRAKSPEIQAMQVRLVERPAECARHGEKGITDVLGECRASGRGSMTFIGDSYAMVAYPPAAAFARARGFSPQLLWHAGCPPVANSDILDYGQQGCAAFRNALFAWLGQTETVVDRAVVVANWPQYLDKIAPQGERSPIPEKDAIARIAREADFALAQMRSRGASKILLVGPHPSFRHLVAECVYRARGASRSDAACAEANERSLEISGAVSAALENVAAKHPYVRFVDSIAFVCPGGKCQITRDEKPLIVDNGHLSWSGAEAFLEFQAASFLWLLEDEAPGEVSIETSSTSAPAP